MKQALNFSPTPFQTHPPALWLLMAGNGLLLLALILFGLRWSALRKDNHAVHDSIRSIEQQETALARQYRDMQNRLESLDIKSYERQYRQFHGIQLALNADWGAMLDLLAQMKGDDVRLVRLISSDTREMDAMATPIMLQGVARHKQAELAFVKALQEHPQFLNVRFDSETYQGQQLGFELRFQFVNSEVNP